MVKDWRPWLATLDGSDDPESAQRAGYAIDYGNGTGFRYVTVQGAGHSEFFAPTVAKADVVCLYLH